MTEPTLAQLYGPDIAAAAKAVNVIRAAAAKANPTTDPGGAIGYLVDAGTQLAGLLGEDVVATGPTELAGIMGAVIRGYVSRVNDAMYRKGEEETRARAAAQQELLGIAAANGHDAGRGMWELTVEQDDIGDAAYFTNYKGIGLPGMLSKARESVFPTDPESGCYRVEPPTRNTEGKVGKSAAGTEAQRPWRIWPALYPYCFNTNDLGHDVPALYPPAAKLMGDLATVGLEATSNFEQDARIVAAAWRRFWTWSAPMRNGLKGGGLVFTGPPRKGDTSRRPTAQRGDLAPASPITPTTTMRRMPVERHAAGERNLYVESNGLTLVAFEGPPPDPPLPPHGRTWYDFSAGYARPIGSCTVDAYNHIVTRFARFFALREHLLRTRAAWEGEDLELLAIGANSPDADLRAALRRPAPPLPVGRKQTSTRGAEVPAVHKQTKPARVGRATPQRVGRVSLADVCDAPTMADFQRRLVRWRSGR